MNLEACSVTYIRDNTYICAQNLVNILNIDTIALKITSAKEKFQDFPAVEVLCYVQDFDGF